VIFFIYWKLFVVLQIKPEINPIHPTPIVSTNKCLPFISAINNKNNQIQNMTSDVDIQISGILFKLRANLAYEKDKKFRLLIKSIVGTESDIGSNNKLFWFWSKRMDKPYIYYAKHEDLFRVGLRNPFQPLWIMDSFGMSTLLTKGSYKKLGNYLVIDEICLSTEGGKVARRTLIDPKLKLIVGQYLINGNQLIASSEILDYQKVDNKIIAKTIKMIWYEENIVIIWRFKNTKINVHIDNNMWTLPNFTKQLDMTKDN
jgi:hypothetical protein